MTVIAVVAPDSLRAEFPFRGLITDHENKLLAAFAMARMFQRMRTGQSITAGLLTDSELPLLAREHHRAKLRGFYRRRQGRRGLGSGQHRQGRGHADDRVRPPPPRRSGHPR